jgi:undecaprenyl-diphosphatase
MMALHGGATMAAMEKRITDLHTFEKLTGYDTRFMVWLLNRPSASQTARIARQVSRLGDGPLYAVLALLLWLAGDSGARHLVLAMVLGFLMELPLYLLLKRTIQRPRPADAQAALNAFIKPSDRFSFPSGHTAAAFMVAVLVSAWYPAMAPLVFSVALAIGASRVLLGVHYPSDIGAGAVLGSSCALLALMLQSLPA